MRAQSYQAALAIANELCAGGSPFCLLHVHMRRNRQLSVLLGFAAVEQLLEGIEARIGKTLRPNDRVLRTGDSDFLIVLPGLLNTAHGELAAQRITREFEQPVAVGGRLITPLLTIGLCAFPDHGLNADVLLRGAAAAVDQALQAGRRIAIAAPFSDDVLLIDELRDALANNELAVAFQPLVSLRERGVVAVEALARWRSPQRGVIAPQRFVELAEQAGLAPELTRWSINASLREFAQLRELAPSLRCSINLSPKVFTLSGLVEQVSAALAIWGVPAKALVLEVTETAVMEDPEYSAIALNRLSDAGIRIAIDDFGQGYSSFTYLKHFPATELKIDQLFVTPMMRDPRAAQLVRAMVDLAHHLDMVAVAEGVEDALVLEALVAMGCDIAQGYHLGRPVDRATLAAVLR